MLEECLRSVRDQDLGEAAEVIVVDNGSADGTASMVRRDYPGVHLVANPTNRGVSAGRNQGLARSRGDYVLLLDDDVRVPPGALAPMTRYMESHVDVGLLGPRLTGPDGSVQASCRTFPTLWIPLASRLGPLRRVPSLRRLLDAHLMTDFDHRAPRNVDYVLGACQLLRRRTLQQVGRFDEGIFYGTEDFDYALRVWRAGWRVVYFPRSAVVHAHRRRSRRVGRLMLSHVKAMARTFWKHGYLLRPPPRRLPTGCGPGRRRGGR